MTTLQDRVIFVTGGGSGIGLACAQLFLESGARVGVADIHEPSEFAMLASIHGSRFAFVSGDVTQPESVDRNFCALTASLGPVDGLVCSAGVTSRKSLMDTPIELWRQTFAVNVEGTFLWMQAAGRTMLERRSGSVVLLASQLVRAGGRGNAAYISAKAALVGLMRTTALEWAEFGVRVNALVPGLIDTPLVRNGYQRFADPEEALRRSAARHALGRIGHPQEIAQAAAFLISDASSFTTGSELTADGGWSIA